MASIENENLLNEYKFWVLKQYYVQYNRGKYDIKATNETVQKLEAELLRRLTIAEESQGFKPFYFISKVKGDDNERVY